MAENNSWKNGLTQLCARSWLWKTWASPAMATSRPQKYGLKKVWSKHNLKCTWRRGVSDDTPFSSASSDIMVCKLEWSILGGLFPCPHVLVWRAIILLLTRPQKIKIRIFIFKYARCYIDTIGIMSIKFPQIIGISFGSPLGPTSLHQIGFNCELELQDLHRG